MNKLRFRDKLTISYILLITVPSIVIGLKYYSTSSQIILENASKHIYEIVKKDNQIIDNRLYKLQESTLSTISNVELYTLLNAMDKDDDMQLIQSDKRIKEILNQYFIENGDIFSANLLTSYYTFGSTNVSISQEKVMDSSVYQEAKQSEGGLVWIPNYEVSQIVKSGEILKNEEYSLFAAARTINSTYFQNGSIHYMDESIERPVLLINVKAAMFNSVFADSLPVTGAYTYVLSPEGRVISPSQSNHIKSYADSAWFKDAALKNSGSLISTIAGRKMLVCFDRMQTTGWMTAAFVPYDQLIVNLSNLRTYTLYLSIFLMILSIIIAYFLSGWLTNPIKKLLVATHLIGIGKFTTKIPVVSDKEFGFLFSKFNQMNEKIQQLITENYEVKLREKEAEIMALNLQLNPHFLYNTLNIINWMAIDKNQDEISRMIISLSTMLEYTVHNKKEVVPLLEDMKWLKGYLHIMSTRYEGIFGVQYEIDPALDNCTVPKLFLQPIIENAIIHGFESLEKGGILRIVGWKSDTNVYFTVQDNGKGISDVQMKKIMDSDSDHVGISNIDKRIKLLFGQEYGITFDSQVGSGTSVHIVFPYGIHESNVDIF
ncbi:cache domain-containing sensor histidine kinase [Paenibacillus aceris]|uniref:Two-component system sensor histidine kinase YesM n=3 Tax=Paenibacillus aceris TaxID=869555 RepID=A0ABS4I056_9BACL|nr:sensor histidine kinase [Paenibacillus aceris]MBP1964309.1 two-component system sensor histidine kinase YesM [Paenibacillus aceris]